MKNSKLFFILLLYFVSSTNAFAQTKQTFSFKLVENTNTSAGIFKSDGTLARTLWSNERMSAGSYTKQWDGKDDNNQPISNTTGFYPVVQTNNVQYGNWSARIGNTSTDLTGDEIHGATDAPLSLSISGNTMYYASGYLENAPMALYKVNLSDIGRRNHFIGSRQSHPNFICNDGTNLYMALYTTQNSNEHNTLHSFITAKAMSTNADVIFSTGERISVYGNEANTSCIGVQSNDDLSLIPYWGLAVQKTGDKLFASRTGFIDVFNKTTGALLQSIASGARPILTVDGSDKLIVGDGNTITKYTANTDGTLTSTGTTYTGVLDCAAISVSPDNNTVAVMDDDITKQVVRFFSNSTGGSYTNTLGVEGGYVNDATVTDYKFYSRDIRTNYLASIAYQSDGSFWVIDGGNGRIQHYSSSRVYIERIMYMSSTYVVRVDPNNSRRLFAFWGQGSSPNAGYLEFDIDPTKNLAANEAGAWTLKKNWGAKIDNSYDFFEKMQNIITISGHTYGIMRGNHNNYDVFELVEGGVARKTKVDLQGFGRKTIAKDGTLYYNPTGDADNQVSIIYSYAYSGLDTDNDPTWSTTGIVVYTTPVLNNDAVRLTSKFEDRKTTSGKWIFYDLQHKTNDLGIDAHLGAIPLNSSNYSFKTSYGTIRDSYAGDFPTNGMFDNGNNVAGPGGSAGGFCAVNGENIVWSYHGEFWKATSTNMFNHYTSNGLMVGNWGTIRSDFTGGHYYGGAINSLYASWVQVTPDKAYLYQGDESTNSGVSRWEITGLSTINAMVLSFNSSLPTLALQYADLMDGITGKGDFMGGNGWTVAPAPSDNDWYVLRGRRTPSRFGNQDIVGNSTGLKDRKIIRTLGNNTRLASWKIDGKISFDISTPNFNYNHNIQSYFEVVDNNDKVIARVSEQFYEYSGDNQHWQFKGNSTTLYEGPNDDHAMFYKSKPFSISNSNGTLTFHYDQYLSSTTELVDPTADINSPSKIQLHFYAGEESLMTMGVSELTFWKTDVSYRSKTSGNWNNPSTWQTTTDGITWVDAAKAPTPDSANTITIQTGHTVTIDRIVAVDQLVINDSASLYVAPNAAIVVNDGDGDDITIAPTGSMVIQSDSTGTGRIGNSDGTISGNVTVERYINSNKNTSYRLLSSSVSTLGSTKPYIRDNWQEGQNNTSLTINSNTMPACGTHISGSTTGANGFDATQSGNASLLLWNTQAQGQTWDAIGNTNSTPLDSKKGYLLLVRGDRSINVNADTPNVAVNTTLRATGKVLTGTQSYTNLEGDSRYSLVTNPYASPIDWKSIYNDVTTDNASNFENYYTYWDPSIGSNGGYVTVNSNGIKSAPTNATTEIQSGEAFFLKAKKGSIMPTFTVKEAHKSDSGNLNIFRTGSPEQFTTSLFYTAEDNTRKIADGVTVVYNNDYSTAVDENDAEEQANWDENFAIARDGKMLSIEGRPLIDVSDTLPLSIERLKQQNYEWQFDPSAFTNTNLQAYLEDNYLHINTSISLSSVTVIPFNVNSDTASSSRNRFRILFGAANILPVNMTSLKAYKKQTDVEVAWSTVTESNITKYEIERSTDGFSFVHIGSAAVKQRSIGTNNYTWTDSMPAPGINYYRLKIISQGSSFEYSKIVEVNIDNTSPVLSIFPNPVEGNSLNLKLNMAKGTYFATLLNILGQEVFKMKFEYAGGVSSQQMQINSNLPPGIYQLKLNGAATTVVQQLMKK